MRYDHFLYTFLGLILSAFTANASIDTWSIYTVSEDGFQAIFPSKPQKIELQVPYSDGSLIAYQAIDLTPLPFTFSVFIGKPKEAGIYEPESINAYLEGHIKSMAASVVDGNILYHLPKSTRHGLPN